MNDKILVIDDDSGLLTLLQLGLEREGFEVATAVSGKEGLRRAYETRPDVVILDIMMPEMDGWLTCQRLRSMCDTPIIMLTAKSQEVDKIVGLELGADDYITKPFSVRELLARIKAVLRRRKDTPRQVETYQFDDVTVDFRKSVAIKGGRTIELSHYEAGILRMLIANKGEPITRNRILDEVWGYELYPTTRTIDNHIVKLRQKLEDDPHNPRHIVTVHGMGYKFID